MFTLSVSVLVIFTVAAAFQPDGDSFVLTSHVNQSCTPFQTPCALGCCPFADAVCCADGFECCQKGQTCIPFVGICVAVVNGEDNDLSLVSSKSTPVENFISVCPSGTTTCGLDKCCLYPAATCCSDGVHCCPHGYRCDLPNKRCIMNSLNDIIPTLTKVSYMPAVKVVKKSPYKTCPGSDKICPRYSSCCIDDNGQWGCCPNPSLNHIGIVGSECCVTIYGSMCCSGEMRKCTVFGCTQ